MTYLIRLSVFGIISFLVSCSLQLQAQVVDYTDPTDYEIGGIKVIPAFVIPNIGRLSQTHDHAEYCKID